MISILLARKIAQLFLILALGLVAARAGIVKTEDTTILSKICLYIISPCVILNCFQVEFTQDIQQGLMLSFGAALIFILILVSLGEIFKKIFRLNIVEQACATYSNSSNLIIPIVASVLGEEWLIYVMAFTAVQFFFFWSHCISLFSSEGKIHLKEIFTNANIIAIFAGLLMMVTGIHFPAFIQEPMASLGNMIGPISMLITGILMSKVSLKQLFCNRRIYLILLLRMFAGPAIILMLIKLTGAASLAPDGEQILLISMLAAAAPVANMISMFAQLYGKDAEYASTITTLTTLSCVVTMPLFVFLYGM